MMFAAAGWTNFPKRVPVFAKPHEGNSIRNLSSACHDFSMSLSSITGAFRHEGV
jgi:hypothetical protein